MYDLYVDIGLLGLFKLSKSLESSSPHFFFFKFLASVLYKGNFEITMERVPTVFCL